MPKKTGLATATKPPVDPEKWVTDTTTPSIPAGPIARMTVELPLEKDYNSSNLTGVSEPKSRRNRRPNSRIAIGTAVPRVNSIVGGAIAAALWLALSSQAWADDWEDCRSNDTAKSVAGCGALIERGGLTDRSSVRPMPAEAWHCGSETSSTMRSPTSPRPWS